MNSLLPFSATSQKTASTPARLSRSRLHTVPQDVQRPQFDPAALRAGIVHLGCGSFHRAHQAFLTQQAIEAEYRMADAGGQYRLPPWGIVAASLRTPGTTRALALQDGLYTVLEHGPQRTRCSVVGTLCGLIFAPDQPLALQKALADPAVRIVSLTITTAGYFADPATGRLDANHPAVQQDLRLRYPATAIGVLVNGLRQRRASGVDVPVVLCCDNLPSNGPLLRQVCIDFAALQGDDQLAAWVAGHVQFPSTMVDRIVPTTTDHDRDQATNALGLIDAAPVSAEPFSQWVIENFDGARPRWDLAGAQYVPDVGPWEASKLRLLNGGHLAIACLGLLAGCETVADAMAVPGFSTYALRFMIDEQKPTLPPSDHDISAYARQLLARWRSRGITHQLERVARDASSKLAARLLASLRENRQAGRPAPCTILAVAAWMRCISGTDDSGRTISLSGVLCQQLHCAVADADPAGLVNTLLGVKEIFGEDLPRDIRLRRSLIKAVDVLQQRGARSAVMACVAETFFDCDG
jgi:fructuronate reductase